VTPYEFACIDSRSGEQVLIFHGQSGPAVDRVGNSDRPVVRPDGKQVAYQAEEDGKEFVVVGDHISPFKPCSNPTFGPDGRVAYLGCRAGRQFLVVDGVPWPPFQEGSLPYFSPNGRFIAYSAGEHGRRFFVMNGRKGLEFDKVNYKLEFAPQGSMYAYIAWRGNKALVVLGDTPGPEFAWVDEPLFSPDGTKVACRARRQIKQFSSPHTLERTPSRNSD